MHVHFNLQIYTHKAENQSRLFGWTEYLMDETEFSIQIKDMSIG